MKFKVGDRVAVYGGISDVARQMYNGEKGTVTFTFEDSINVEMDDGKYWSLHPKQCRKLKTKKKAKSITFTEKELYLAYKYEWCNFDELLSNLRLVKNGKI